MVANASSLERCARVLLIGTLFLGPLSQDPAKAKGATSTSRCPDGPAASSNKNRKIKISAPRKRNAKRTVRPDREKITVSDEINGNRGAKRVQKRSKSNRVGRGVVSTGSGVAKPQKTTEEKPSQKAKDRDKLLDQVNLPVPVPPGKSRNSNSSPVVDPSTSPGKEPLTSQGGAKANNQPANRKPNRRKHEK